ncbi:hypothetical protein INR49_008529 [Caranx melampygus]|nr:hypothetical protein INR49_008529 [Caranx melampygus]
MLSFPCYMGINIPTKEELIANKPEFQDIAGYIGADSVQYLTVEGLVSAVQEGIASIQEKDKMISTSSKPPPLLLAAGFIKHSVFAGAVGEVIIRQLSWRETAPQHLIPLAAGPWRRCAATVPGAFGLWIPFTPAKCPVAFPQDRAVR